MAKSSEKPAETPGIGHNGEKSDAEIKALKMEHFRKIREQKTKLDAEQGVYKTLRKDAKADGITLADIDFMMRCANVDDPSIIPDELKRQAEMASWFALPVLFQPDMFGDFSREPGEDRAKREGQAAGASGHGSNPYDENTAQGRAWAFAWSEEQGKQREALKSAMEKRNAAKAAEEGGDLDDEAAEAA